MSDTAGVYDEYQAGAIPAKHGVTPPGAPADAGTNPPAPTVTGGSPPKYGTPGQTSSGTGTTTAPGTGSFATGLKNPATGNDLVWDPQTAQYVDAVTGQPIATLGGQTPHDRMVAEATTTYFNLWGIMPPEGYIDSLLKAGMNVYEIEQYERSKPAFARTQGYQATQQDFVAQLLRIMGRTA